MCIRDRPIPNLNLKGVDLIFSSGATAVFILESAVTKGLQFNSVWSVGNAKQIGVEDVLFIGGSDEHGVPITIRAKKEGITPQLSLIHI